MTEGYLPVCDLAVNTGANIPVPTIQFDEDSTYGTYIKRIRLGSIAFTFAPQSMFEVGLWNEGAETFHELVDEAFEPTITTDAATGVMTIVHELDSPYTGISFTYTLTPIAEGYQVSSIVVTNTNATYGVSYFEFPRMGCQAPSGVAGNAYLAHGFIGGMVLKDPHTVTLTDVTRNAMSSPGNMQYMSYWDVTTKEHLYFATDDDDGCTKHYMLRGDDSSVTGIAFRHWVPNPRRAGNDGETPYTVPYTVNMELFKGRTADGRCGHYDAALRYRCWGTHGDRPWVTGGAWTTSPTISDRVKDSDCYYISGHSNSSAPANFWSDIVEDMSRVQDLIGATDMLGLLYGWAENIAFLTDLEPPAFTPLIQGADQDTALGVAAAAGIHLSYYTLPAFWETSLDGSTTPFDLTDFTGNVAYGDLTNYLIRDQDGNPYNPDLQPGTPVFPEP